MAEIAGWLTRVFHKPLQCSSFFYFSILFIFTSRLCGQEIYEDECDCYKPTKIQTYISPTLGDLRPGLRFTHTSELPSNPKDTLEEIRGIYHYIGDYGFFTCETYFYGMKWCNYRSASLSLWYRSFFVDNGKRPYWCSTRDDYFNHRND